MSFLAGRLAATEGAFFSQNSKQAMLRLKEKLNATATNNVESRTSGTDNKAAESNADILPEILQHNPVSLPEFARVSSSPSRYAPLPSSLAASLASPSPSLSSARRSSNSSNPLNFFAGVPQTSLGPGRWKPKSDDLKTSWSTANEVRMEDGIHIDLARAQALMEGYSVVFKAFLIATALVIGGTTTCTILVFSRLQIKSLEDIPAKGREHIRPQVEAIQQQMAPWRQWVLGFKEKCNLNDDSKYKEIGTTIAKSFEVKKGLDQSELSTPQLMIDGTIPLAFNFANGPDNHPPSKYLGNLKR